ncbi:MAG: hypothetical protein IH800_01000 [Myxococcales bacterium]|nr:hypothetical protein [Myxococcales bacterium]
MTPRGSAGWVCVALLAATLAAYWEVPRLGFVDFDDFDYVVENPQVQGGLTLEGARWAWTTAHLGYWAPLLWLSYMLDVELYGPGAAGHHLTNLLLHVANVLLLFALLWRSTRSLWASACVALVFAVHPLNVESVAWVTERKNVLSTLFWLLATAYYVSYRERGSRSAYALLASCMLLGLMVKATLVTLPIVLLLMDVWPLKAARSVRGLLRLGIEKLPLLLLSAAASGFTYLAQREAGAISGFVQLSLGLRAENAIVSYVRYLGKWLWPSHLAVLYPYPSLLGVDMWSALQVGAAGTALAAMTALALREARRRPYLFVGWCWYGVVLVPLIGLVQVGEQALADRHMYLPMIGLLIVVAWGAADLVGRWRYGKPVAAAATALVVIACIACTRAQVSHWRNSLTLFERAVAVTDDNWVALNNVAWYRATCPDVSVRDGARAVALAERACEITRYLDGEYLDTLAAAYAEAGRFEEAASSSRRAIALATSAGRTRLADVFRKRLAHHSERRPYRSSRGCP